MAMKRPAAQPGHAATANPGMVVQVKREPKEPKEPKETKKSKEPKQPKGTPVKKELKVKQEQLADAARTAVMVYGWAFQHMLIQC